MIDPRTSFDGRAHLVCGMHRSGTSMVAAMLRACGVHLGGDDELVAAAADNPRGFAEHRQVVDIDDRVLAALGSAWDLPPRDLPEGWWTADSLGGLRHRAQLVLASLADGSPSGHWALKDPRLSLLLSFWRSMLHDHRVVVCVRNPLEVAASLVDRNGCSTRLALDLWEQYHRRIDEDLPSTHRLVVHYAAVLADPIGQMERIAAAVGLDGFDPSTVTGAVDRGERHHRFGAAELRHVGVPAQLVDRYLSLCDEAGWAEPATATGAPAPAPAPPGAPLDPDAVERVRLSSELHVRGGHIGLLGARVSELEGQLAAAPATVPEPGAEAAPAVAAVPRRVGRALVVQHRLPEFDRERGSLRVLEVVDALVGAGWHVEFWALDVTAESLATDPDQRRYADRLTSAGVAVHAGDTGTVWGPVDAGVVDLCVVAFWHVGERVIGELRSRSPRTRIVVDSIDLHFLRESRRVLDRVGPGGLGALSLEDGARMVGELNVYAGADAVLTVSEHEARLVDDMVGRTGLGCTVPLGDPIAASTALEPTDRHGVVFVGNFRHLPNIEAVAHLVAAVAPRMDPDLLAAHPVRVVGNALDDRVRAVGTFPGVDLVGWVPDVAPHLHAARVSVVPLLHGAGVKGKVIQSLLAGTPVVSTSVGVEGLELPDDGVSPVVVVDDDAGFAAAVTRLLTDDDEWRARRDAGLAWARRHHGGEVVAAAVLDAVDLDRLASAGGSAPSDGADSRRWSSAYERIRAGVLRAAAAELPDDARVLVASGGDDDLVNRLARVATHFPGSEEGHHLGWNPDGSELIDRLDAANLEGWTHLVLPATRFWWLHCHPELRVRLAGTELVHDGADCRIWDLGAVPVLVHVDPAVADAPQVRDRLRRALAGLAAGVDVVHLPTEVDSPPSCPPLVRQLGSARRMMVGLGAGPAVAARGAAAVGALWSALRGEPGALQSLPALVLDDAPVGAGPSVAQCAVSTRCRILQSVTMDGVVTEHSDDAGGGAHPFVSVVVATRDRAELLEGCLRSLEAQVVEPGTFEVVVVDDGSTDTTPEVLTRWARRLPLRRDRLAGCGRSAAKNLGVLIARGDLVLLLDDDDRLLPDAIAAYLTARSAAPREELPRLAVLGHTDWASELAVTPLMRHVTEVGCQLFAYPALREGVALDWRHFWEGRLMVSRGLLVAEGLHDQRLVYSIDVELGRRLDRVAPITVRYAPAARGVMARPVDLGSMVTRAHAKGRAQRRIAELHPDDEELVGYCVPSTEERPDPAEVHRLMGAATTAAVALGSAEPSEAAELAAALDGAYLAVLRAANLAGLFHDGELGGLPAAPAPQVSSPPVASPGRLSSNPPQLQPELSVIMPVWSLTEDLARMATRTLERVRQVARLRTEIIVIDNGSPVPTDLSIADRVIALEENRGVGPGWNLGASVAAAPLLCFLNSDCTVHPGWDRALAHAASDGRRIAFPYTDHGDGRGPRRPDQAGTAGWCFVLHRDLFAEVGGFDERFAPAYFEDTDYWHRAWEMGVGLDPVVDAVVHHERRTTGRHDPRMDEIFTRNRRRYEAKHGVGFDAPPPYYHREVIDYPPPGRVRLARMRPWASEGADRPRVFGIGMNKTGTSSLHAALRHLGYTAVHHGSVELRRSIEAAAAEGRPLLSDIDPDLDALCDIAAITSGFAELDRDYSGSKFILTVRDVDDWVSSRIRHVEANRSARDAGRPHGNFMDIDVEAWVIERDAHHAAVLAHFAGRPDDLLVLDLCAGQGWERLAPFLGWERIPERPFPWENRSGVEQSSEVR